VLCPDVEPSTPSRETICESYDPIKGALALGPAQINRTMWRSGFESDRIRRGFLSSVSCPFSKRPLLRPKHLSAPGRVHDELAEWAEFILIIRSTIA
jgi:hypothetical protein